jgi:hypothetical protein
MNNDDFCREVVAKLMANENISVNHSTTAKTASFDVNNRVLVLPIWKDTDKSVYTLLISHEVGHALYTTKSELLNILQELPHLKQIINVIEDARIEKLIQQKYPGIKYQFKRGYMQLFNKNFFGTKNRTADSYNLLDRLNIHFKVGGFGYYNLPFSIDEYQWIEKIDNCKTFSDVVSVSKQLYDYMSEQEPKSEDAQQTKVQTTDLEEPSSEPSNYEDFQTEKTEQSEQNAEEFPQSSKSAQTQNENAQDELGEQLNGDGPTNNQLNSETQTSFESNISNTLIDSCKSYYNLKIPKIALDDIIVNYKYIHQNLSQYYKRQNFKCAGQDKVNKFKHSVSMSVNSMSNIFEMKKKASLYCRSKVDKTGQLDMNKIHSYRYNDNIFKKITTTPNGKSHGMVMFFDMSGSMKETISSCLEQILVLCMFCKKINIPFDVYGFSDYASQLKDECYHSCSGELKIKNDFKLRHYLSSKMTNAEYESALSNILNLAQSYQDIFYHGAPIEETLNATPLLPCILYSKNVIMKFKREYNLDIVNAIYLTDGDDTHGILADSARENIGLLSNVKIVIKSDVTNKEYVIKNSDDGRMYDTTQNLFKIVKDETGANIISFYLLSKPIDAKSYLLPKNINIDSVVKSYKSNNFYQISNHLGYDSFYFIKSNCLSLDSGFEQPIIDATDDFDYTDHKKVKQNIKKIVKSFDKQMTTSIKNKMFLNKFIEQIA